MVIECRHLLHSFPPPEDMQLVQQRLPPISCVGPEERARTENVAPSPSAGMPSALPASTHWGGLTGFHRYGGLRKGEERSADEERGGSAFEGRGRRGWPQSKSEEVRLRATTANPSEI